MALTELNTKAMKIIETFREISGYDLIGFTQDKSSCFNGIVRIEKYKITIEKIEESKEVYKERLQKLWDECDNIHHWTPMREKAKQLGVVIEGSAGSKKN